LWATTSGNWFHGGKGFWMTVAVCGREMYKMDDSRMYQIMLPQKEGVFGIDYDIYKAWFGTYVPEGIDKEVLDFCQIDSFKLTNMKQGTCSREVYEK